MVRLERGGAEFLTAVRDRLVEISGEDVYSPALYPGSTRVWRRSGFVDHAVLTVMERSLTGLPTEPPSTHRVKSAMEVDWSSILDIDRKSFQGFWGMSRLGLEEALETNPATTLLTAPGDTHPGGFAIVGAQWAVAYLHRIAVRPDRSGEGLGRALLEAAMRWGAAHGAKAMVLNVRAENARAIRLYARSGFTNTGTELQILRHHAD